MQGTPPRFEAASGGRTALASVHHDGSPRYVRGPVADPAAGLEIGDAVTIRLRASLDAPLDRVLLRTCPDGEQVFADMDAAGVEAGCRWWETTIRLNEPVVTYRFALISGGRLWWLNGWGLAEASPTDAADFRLLAGYAPPGWLDDAVLYQIFPDRFANGDPATDVQAGEWSLHGIPARARSWDEPPGTGLPALVEFYGGDLPGIESRLDHLESLGVNCIYLTPIFDSLSNHGYDAVDYRKVARHFGGDEALASLRIATRRRGIRLLLDLAPNHVGSQHPWFRAAQADGGAETAEFFTFNEHPHEYESWLGHRSLAKLDYRSEALRNEMYAAPDSIVRHWLRPPFSIDGWRIDVANMLGRLGPVQLNAEVAGGIRGAARSENPAAYLLGENWFDATAQLQGDQWDSVMNYAGFTTPLLEWLAGVELESPGQAQPLTAGRISTSAFLETLGAFRAAIPWRITCQQLLLLGSHDTPRIRNRLHEDRRLLELAFGILLTYPGVPCIFYGDEIGLTGASSIEARRTMSWDRGSWDERTFELLRRLIAFRRSLAALRHGGFEVLDATADSIVYLRDSDEDAVVVVANRGPGIRPAGALPVGRCGVPNTTRFREAFSGESVEVAGGHLELPAIGPGIAIWVAG